MSESDLDVLLNDLAPRLADGTYVFCTVPGGTYGDFAELAPLGAFVETEGLSLVLPRERALAAGLAYDGEFALISLGAYSSLAAVGLTAAIATVLASNGISANVVAAFHHDHVFVPADCANDALRVLQTVGRRPNTGAEGAEIAKR